MRGMKALIYHIIQKNEGISFELERPSNSSALEPEASWKETLCQRPKPGWPEISGTRDKAGNYLNLSPKNVPNLQ